MADRAALVITVESFAEAGPPIPYATADAVELHRLLPSVGYNPAKCLLLTSHRTTKAIIESHLNRLPKLIGKPDALMVFIISRGCSLRQRGYIACFDTITVDLPGTALAIADLIASLRKCKVPEVAVLLDLDPLQRPGELAPGGINAAELHTLCDVPKTVIMLAAAPGERSHESAQLRHGIWRHHVLDAFSGHVRDAANNRGEITAARLQVYMESAVPRTVQRSYDSHANQTPLMVGFNAEGVVLADIADQLAAKPELLDPTRMRRVVFRSERIGRVKELAGFRKSHSLPERANEWARKYIHRIAQVDLKADLDTTYDMIREAFGFKRKDLDVSAGRDGAGFIRTPEFEYTVTVDLNPLNPAEVVWRRDVGRLDDPAIVHTPAFLSVFGPDFDKLIFEFAMPINVAEFVDQIEASPLEGVRLGVASDADFVEVKLAGIAGRITVTCTAVQIEGRSRASGGLLDHFLAFLRKFSGLRELKALSS